MELILESYKKISRETKIIFFIFFFYFLIPGNLKIRIDSYSHISLQNIFLFFSSGFFLFIQKKNYSQIKLFLYLLHIIIFTYLLSIIFFLLQENSISFSYEYFANSMILSFIHSLSLIFFSLIIFFYWKGEVSLLKILDLIAIILILEFLVFITSYEYLDILKFFYRNVIFDDNGIYIKIFRSIFIGDHITTSSLSFVLSISFLFREKKNFRTYLCSFILFIIAFYNYESKLNIANMLYLLGVFSITKILRIKFKISIFIILLIFYIFASILFTIFLKNIAYFSLFSLNGIIDRIILSLHSLDILFSIPIPLGYDNLRFIYTEFNHFNNISIKMLIDPENIGLQTLAALNSVDYLNIWKTISSPHNILILLFSSYGLWIVYFVKKYTEKINNSNLKITETYLMLIFCILIFSIWNQVWHIDFILIFLIIDSYKNFLRNDYKKKYK